MRITNSMVKAYQRCPRQYWYKFDEKIVPRSVALPLKRGSWLHELLETKYSGGDWRARNEELAREFNGMFEEERIQYGDLPEICANIMMAYEYTWRDEDREFDVLCVEEEFEVPLPHGHTLVFKVDGIIEDEWGKWLLEHKSHKTLPNSEYRFIDMQSARYVWGLNKLGWDLTGVLWNYIRTKEPTKPPLLKSGGISKAKRYDTDAFTLLRTLKEYGLDPHDYRDVIIKAKNNQSTFFRRERVPKPATVMKELVADVVHIADTIERGYHPTRSIDRSCTFTCSYLSVCSTSLYGGDVRDIIETHFQTATKETYYGYTDEESQA